MLLKLWQQLAHLERPAWVVKRERDVIDLLLSLAWCNSGDDAWGMVMAMAEKWKEEDAREPPDLADASFFRGLIPVEQTKSQERNRKKKERRKRKSAEGKFHVLCWALPRHN